MITNKVNYSLNGKIYPLTHKRISRMELEIEVPSELLEELKQIHGLEIMTNGLAMVGDAAVCKGGLGKAVKIIEEREKAHEKKKRNNSGVSKQA